MLNMLDDLYMLDSLDSLSGVQLVDGHKRHIRLDIICFMYTLDDLIFIFSIDGLM